MKTHTHTQWQITTKQMTLFQIRTQWRVENYTKALSLAVSQENPIIFTYLYWIECMCIHECLIRWQCKNTNPHFFVVRNTNKSPDWFLHGIYLLLPYKKELPIHCGQTHIWLHSYMREGEKKRKHVWQKEPLSNESVADSRPTTDLCAQ